MNDEPNSAVILTKSFDVLLEFIRRNVSTNDKLEAGKMFPEIAYAVQTTQLNILLSHNASSSSLSAVFEFLVDNFWMGGIHEPCLVMTPSVDVQLWQGALDRQDWVHFLTWQKDEADGVAMNVASLEPQWPSLLPLANKTIETKEDDDFADRQLLGFCNVLFDNGAACEGHSSFDMIKYGMNGAHIEVVVKDVSNARAYRFD